MDSDGRTIVRVDETEQLPGSPALQLLHRMEHQRFSPSLAPVLGSSLHRLDKPLPRLDFHRPQGANPPLLRLLYQKQLTRAADKFP